MTTSSSKPETLSDMLPPQEELEADLARLAEIQELRAEDERLQERAAHAEKVWKELGASREQLQIENERLREVINLARIHHHDGCKGCFAVQSAVRKVQPAPWLPGGATHDHG